MDAIVPTPRTTLARRPNRGIFDRAQLNAILDEALVCHIGFVVESQPYVLPTIYARIDDRLYVHGSVASRMLRTLDSGASVCVTVTLIDGLVLARSAFHHSMNYRSVVILGVASLVRDNDEKLRALNAIVDHVVPGRSCDTRSPDPQELKATSVLSLPISEASAKIRSGPPIDAEEDYALPHWAGVIPLKLQPQPPQADPRLTPGTPVPQIVSAYRRPGSV